MKKYILIILISFFIQGVGYSQLSHIKEDAEKEKRKKENKGYSGSSHSKKKGHSSSSSNDSDDDDDLSIGEELLLSLLEGMIYLIVESLEPAQKSALASAENYPERTSLTIPIAYGVDLQQSTDVFKGSFEGNYGIIGTTFDYFSLRDLQDRLNYFTWLIDFKIPIKPVTINYGIGLSYLSTVNTAYFASGLSFDWKIKDNLFLSGDYTWTNRLSSGKRFKESFSARIEKLFIHNNKLHFGPCLMYSHESYFSRTKYSFTSLGLVMKVF